jgi:hypothetical protein
MAGAAAAGDHPAGDRLTAPDGARASAGLVRPSCDTDAAGSITVVPWWAAPRCAPRHS